MYENQGLALIVQLQSGSLAVVWQSVERRRGERRRGEEERRGRGERRRVGEERSIEEGRGCVCVCGGGGGVKNILKSF